MRPPRARAGSGPRGGHTLIEVVVAFAVLAIGSAVLWYTVRASARAERQNRLHHEANLMARSELEAVRLLPRREVRDTSYRVPASGGDTLLVVREVFDSSRVLEALPEVALDENLSPVELRKPLEVRVRVLQGAGDGEEAIPDPASAWAPREGGPRVLASLLLKLPEYRWH